MKKSLIPPEPSAALPGCHFIYAPSGEAGEYAPLAANPYRGCGHRCKYCYVPAAIHMRRVDFDRGAELRQTFFPGLARDLRKYRATGSTGQVMLSFTSDPYHAGDTTPTRRTLEMLGEAGMAFCPLTKGGTRAFRDLSLFRPDRDAFAVTLTGLDDAFSLNWEPGAPLPGERIAALRRFHTQGIYTWVSLEPTLSTAASLAVILATHGFVDLYKIGRANYCGALTKNTDWRDYTLRLLELLNRLGAKHYIKQSLQEWLPPGYPNPMRVPQHH